MDLKFDGKRALITGGSRGLGYAVAEAEKLAADVSVGRFIQPSEVAHVVAFLASLLSVAINRDAVIAGGGLRGPIFY